MALKEHQRLCFEVRAGFLSDCRPSQQSEYPMELVQSTGEMVEDRVHIALSRIGLLQDPAFRKSAAILLLLLRYIPNES